MKKTHAEFCKLLNEELPEGIIVYHHGENEYKFTFSEKKSTSIAKQAELKQVIKDFIAKYNGTITSHDNYYCIIAKF